MAARIGINGFDGNARMILRLLDGKEDLEVTHINSAMPPERMSYLLTHDDLRGVFPFSIDHDENHLIINKKNILITHFETAGEIPWEAAGVNYVIENQEIPNPANHFRAGVRKVILSYLPDNSEGVRTIVMGVNHFDLQSDDGIISVASGDTHCCAMMLKVLHDEFGVVRSLMSAVSSSASAVRAIPTVMPEMRGLFDGFSASAPTDSGSFVELTAELHHSTTAHDVREAFRRHAEGPLSGFLAFTRGPIAAGDVIGRPQPALFDAISTRVIGGNLVQTVCWFDETASQSNRIIDIIKYIQSYE